MFYVVSASLILLVSVLENPQGGYVHLNLRLLKSVVRYISRLKDDQGFDLANLRAAMSEMVRIAQIAISSSEISLQPSAHQGLEATEASTKIEVCR